MTIRALPANSGIDYSIMIYSDMEDIDSECTETTHCLEIIALAVHSQ